MGNRKTASGNPMAVEASALALQWPLLIGREIFLGIGQKDGQKYWRLCFSGLVDSGATTGFYIYYLVVTAL